MTFLKLFQRCEFMIKSVRYISVILILSIAFLTLSGCGENTDMAPQANVNLIQNAMNISVNNKTLDTKTLEAQMGAFSGEVNTVYEVLFEQPTDVNTIVLSEGTESSVRSFAIEAEKNGEYVRVYEQDIIGSYRYCAFDTITTNGFRIIITEVEKDTQFNITSTEAFFIQRGREEFKVTSYALGSDVYKKEFFNSGALNIITDIIVFGLTSFDSEGSIIYNDILVDNKTVSGKDALKKVIENVRGFAGQLKKQVRIHINLLGPEAVGTFNSWEDEMIAKGDLHALAFEDNREKLVASVISLVNEFGVDGIYFDYEYPIKSNHKKAFGNFLRELKKNMPDKILGAALASWCMDLSRSAIDSLDAVEIMAYDQFDFLGNHSSFESGVSAIEAFIEQGYERKKLSLGIPFYARPSDQGAFWYSYSLEADKLGKYKNFVTGPALSAEDKCETRYYNSYQMTYDKTAYAYDSGIGGVMVWHLNCDLPFNNEISLFKAISDSLHSN